MIHGFGCNAQFTSKKIKGRGCFIFLRHNKSAGHPCSHFYDLSAGCSYFCNSSVISWHLPVESLTANIGRWPSGFQFHNSPTSSERSSRPLGMWMAGAPVPFKTKWPQAPGNSPNYSFGRVHVLGIGLPLAYRPCKGLQKSTPHPWAGSARCISHQPCNTCFSVPKTCCDRCFPADCFTVAASALLESSPSRSWLPRWFREIIPKIITFHCLDWRDGAHPE